MAENPTTDTVRLNVADARPEIVSEPGGEDLKLILGEFAGPFDLLLYLIKQEQANIFDIPIARITDEYLKYVRLMKSFDLTLAADFLVMAATLIEIKSKMLLPKEIIEETEEEIEDPREALVRQLLEHQKFKNAAEMLQHALGASQRIMMNLRPAILDQGLVAAVDWLASGFERRTGIRTTFRSTTTDQILSKEIQLAAYRTAQEALTNISKHARCTQVGIDLTDTNSVLTLEISDNGQGFAPALVGKPKAFGLKGLHERAKSVGGWLDISTAAGRGASIILSVPLAQATSAGPKEAVE